MTAAGVWSMVWVPMQLRTQRLPWRSTPQLQEGSSAGRTFVENHRLLRRQVGSGCRSAPSPSVGFAWQRAGADSHPGPTPTAHNRPLLPLLSALPRSSASRCLSAGLGGQAKLSPIPRTSPCPLLSRAGSYFNSVQRGCPRRPLNPHPAVLYCLPRSLALAAQMAWLK